MKVEPLGSEATEIIGIVRERSKPDLENRYSLSSNSVGFHHLSKIIVDVDPVQLAVTVDELATDPSAIDLLSYSFSIPSQLSGKEAARNVVIEAMSGIRI